MALTAITSANFSDATASQRVAILMHGYGSHEHDLAGLASYLPEGMAWASLRAPISMGMGAAWFALGDDWLQPAPIEDATAAVWEWIDARVPASCAVTALGFSQGGLMATQLLRTRPQQVRDVVVLSGFVLNAPQPGDEELAQTRPAVFWGRGTDDSIISDALVDDAARWFAGHVTLTEHVERALGHSVSDAELIAARRYLTRNEI